MYTCPTGERLRLAWYRQKAAGEPVDWVDLAKTDYANHRHACPICHQIVANFQGNLPIAIQLSQPVLIQKEESNVS